MQCIRRNECFRIARPERIIRRTGFGKQPKNSIPLNTKGIRYVQPSGRHDPNRRAHLLCRQPTTLRHAIQQYAISESRNARKQCFDRKFQERPCRNSLVSQDPRKQRHRPFFRPVFCYLAKRLYICTPRNGITIKF